MAAALLALALLAVGGHAVPSRPPQLTFEQIEHFLYLLEFRPDLKISQEDVEAAIGRPGDYRTGPPTPLMGLNGPMIGTWRFGEPLYVLKWQADALDADIGFDSTRNVVKISVGWKDPVEHTALDQMLWRVQRQWRALFP